MTIDKLPTAPQRTDSSDVFVARADAFVAAFPIMVDQINSQIAVFNNPALMATSTTSVAIGTGSKSFTIETGKSFLAGRAIQVSYTTDPTKNMSGTITSYDSGTGALVVNVTSTSGSGTLALWTVTITDGGATATETLSNKTLKSVKETRTAPTISAGVLTLDLSTSSVFDVALNAAITTLTISNPAASGTSHGFILNFTADGTPRAVTWPASVLWPAAVAPTLTSTNGKTDKFIFHTTNGGTPYFAYVAGQNS